MKTLTALLADRDALVARMAADGFEMTDEVRAERDALAEAITTARADEEALTSLRSQDAPAAVRAVDMTANPAAGVATQARTAEPETRGIDVAANLEAFIQRGSRMDDRIQVRAALTTSSLFGGTAVPTRDDRGFQPTIEEPTTFLSLFPSTSTDADLISYVREVPTTNTAAETAEGQTKPEGNMELEEVTHGFSTIANWITVTRQALRSRSLLQSAIEGRLTSNVRARANSQVWDGDGLGANIEGLRNAGIVALPAEFGTDGYGIYRSIKRARTEAAKSLVPATHVVLNPEDAETLEVYLESTSRAISLGLTVVTSYDQPAGSAVVGALSNPAVLEILYRDGMEVYASREHSDNLTRNLVTILGEQEAGLAVYKPNAVVEVTFGEVPVAP